MILELDRESHVPLYTQIAERMREKMREGALKVGDRLPPNRELAKSLGVNRGTVTTAYDELMADGLLSSQVGRGTFVSALPAGGAIETAAERAPASPMPWGALLTDERRDPWLNALAAPQSGAISFAHALPPAELFPLDAFRRSVERVLRKEGRQLLSLGSCKGYEPLRQYLSAQMALSGIHAQPDEILITNGCQQSLDLLQRILVRPGDEVAVENPVYPGAISVFCNAQAKYTSIPVGPRGLNLDVLEDVLAHRRPKLIYTVPGFHNPTGVTMDVESRRRLLDIAAHHRVPIVEDDIFRELRYDGAALPPLKALDRHGLVIYLNSFSKVGFPGLRVGWIAAPRIVIERLGAMRQQSDFHTSLLVQAAIHDFAKRGALAKHIQRCRKAYAQRRDAMLAALERHFPAEARWNKPDGGLAVWVQLPDTVQSARILMVASEQGVTFCPGELFYASAPQSNRMRLAFSTATPAQIEDGVRRLGVLLKTKLAAAKQPRWFGQVTGVQTMV
jgi:GntR family transcriptional regulator/MocR family aminotransferase